MFGYVLRIREETVPVMRYIAPSLPTLYLACKV